jgi:hypothetical protein
MNRYLQDRAKAQQNLQEWHDFLAQGLSGSNRKGYRKPRRDELVAVLRLPGDPVPMIRWSCLDR